jgi:SAM-dependent methyltransferase
MGADRDASDRDAADGGVASPGAGVSARWAAWRAQVDLGSYEERWRRMADAGRAVHGEADLVASYAPGHVLDAGCGTGRVAIELDRRGIDVAGADLDDDMLVVARRLAPHITWLHADLARDPLGGPYDLVVMAGNVPVFCRPSDRRALVANLAAHLEPAGRLLAGFSLESRDDALTLADYDDACSAAGLRVESRWSTWDRAPFPPPGGPTPDYAVTAAVRRSVADA